MAKRQTYETAYFCDWVETPLGQSLLDVERTALRTFLPAMRGGVALQIGSNGTLPLLDTCNFPHRFVLRDPQCKEPIPDQSEFQVLQSQQESLPFGSDSVDLCLLPHVLDFSPRPHELLREVERILVSGGHVVMLGFNPYSAWGIRKFFSSASAQPPWQGHYLSVRRMRDWLRLLDFDINAGTMLYYRPPLSNATMRDRLRFLEKAGNRWWPMLAGVYLLVAQKNVAGMTVIEVNKQFRKISYLQSAEPVAKKGERLYG